MANQVVQVPVSLLLCPDLPASAKLVWMVARTASDRQGTTWLDAATGLTRPTVRQGLARLTSAGWDPTLEQEGPTVPVPIALLQDRRLGVQAKLLYGLLLLTPGFHHPGGQFIYDELAHLAQAGRNTVARAVEALVRAEWLKVERTNRLAPIHFAFTFPGLARGLAAQDDAQRRLDKASYRGEGLMREYLSLLVDSEAYENDATPGFLVNPRTGERLQLDRFYPPDVAFEFNGPQHYRATAKFSADQASGQRERDYIKLGICVSRGITLVTIHPEELTLKGMQQAVGSLLPLRNLTGHELLIDYLETESHTYRRLVAKL